MDLQAIKLRDRFWERYVCFTRFIATNGIFCSLFLIFFGFFPIHRFAEKYSVRFFDFGSDAISIVSYVIMHSFFLILIVSIYANSSLYTYLRVRAFDNKVYYADPFKILCYLVLPIILFFICEEYGFINFHEGALIYLKAITLIVWYVIIVFYYFFTYHKIIIKDKINFFHYVREHTLYLNFIIFSWLLVRVFILGHLPSGISVNGYSIHQILENKADKIVLEFAFFFLPFTFLCYCFYGISRKFYLKKKQMLAIFSPFLTLCIVLFVGSDLGAHILFSARAGFYTASVVIEPETCRTLKSEDAFTSDVICGTNLQSARVCIIYGNYNSTYIGKYNRENLQEPTLTNKSIRIHTSELKSIVLEGPCS